jgi:hypothetical protein
MNDYERENMVAWGRLAAVYLNKDAGALEVMAIDSFIDGEHTRYMVGKNTGDARLARMAGNSAILSYWHQYGLIFGIPAAAFTLGTFVCYGLGKAIGVSPGVLAALWGAVCFAMIFWVGHKVQDMRNTGYVRANLPTERTLNRAGYYEVEPDVWFNMITNRVLQGHCYRPAEQAQARQVGRSESQQIRDLYRQQRGRGRHTPQVQARTPYTGKLVRRVDSDGIVREHVEW